MSGASRAWAIDHIIGLGGRGNYVVRVETRPDNDFQHDSRELRYTRRSDITRGVNNPG